MSFTFRLYATPNTSTFDRFTGLHAALSAFRTFPTTKRGISALISDANSMNRVR